MGRLDRLLRPRSIAVIGGGAWCAAVITQNRKIGFTGDIWPIHPQREEVAGHRAYRSLADLPGVPDAAFVGVNRRTTVDVVAGLSGMGAGGAVCFASGFAETADGAELHSALLGAAGEMPILGPNCYGVLNGLDGVALWPDQHGLVPVQSGVAIVAQSSNIAINLTMQTRGLPIAYVITAGNQAQQGLAQIAAEVLADPRVTALGLYIESFGDIRAFEAMAATAAALGKPIVALKVGRSEASQRATMSHTASLAGGAAGADALMKRLGIASVTSLTVLLETLKIMHCFGRLPGARIASLSCSGGEASVMADTAARHGVRLPALPDAQRALLAQHLSAMVTLVNPLDYHTDVWRNRLAMRAVFSAMQWLAVELTVVVLDFPNTARCDDVDWLIAVDAIEDAAKATGKRFAVLASMTENMPERFATRLLAAGIVPLCGFDDACAAIAAAACPLPISPPPVLVAGAARDADLVTEAAAKSDLMAFGLDVPRHVADLPLAALWDAAVDMGFPVVLKAEGIAHKTEAGAVALNLVTPEAVVSAARQMPAQRFLLEEMITGGLAELLVGVVRDAAVGFVLTIGAGGTLTELLVDRRSLLIPSDAQSVRAALAELKVGALLGGHRGGPAANLEAIVRAIMQLQDYVIANAAAIAEVEINPLICTHERAIVADALLVKGTT